MNKTIKLLSLAALAFLPLSNYCALDEQIQALSTQDKLFLKSLTVFFHYAQEEISKVKVDIERLEANPAWERSKKRKLITVLEDNLKTYKVVDLIVKGDIEALKKMNTEELQFEGGQIWVPNNRFDVHSEEKAIDSRILAGTDALAFVIFYSAVVENPEDKEKVLEMAEVLLAKGFNVNNTQLGRVCWIDENGHMRPYSRLYTPLSFASAFSFKEFTQLLEKHSRIAKA